MKLRRFCARCGAQEPDTVIVDGLCPRCYLEIHGGIKLIRELEIVYCPHCYSVKLGNRWYPLETVDDYKQILQTMITRSIAPATDRIQIKGIDFELPEPFQPSLRLRLILNIGGKVDVPYELVARLRWRKTLCPNCFSRAAKSFRAVVQLRFLHASDEFEKLKNELTQMFPDYITEIEDVKNGFDVKVTSEHVARKIASIIRNRWPISSIVESYGDERRSRNGRRTAKLYISLRILNLKPGDYVVLKKRAYTVERVDSNYIIVRDSSGKLHRIPKRELSSLYTKT